MEVANTSNQESAARLARIFPGAAPMRVPVRLDCANGNTERTTIEFGTTQEFIFHAAAILAFDDVVRLRNHNGSLDITARVIALQWSESRQVVAARLVVPKASKAEERKQ